MNHGYKNSERYHEILKLAATTDEPKGMLAQWEMAKVPHAKVGSNVITESGWLYTWDEWYGMWKRQGREVK